MPPQQALRGHLWGGANKSITLSIVVVKSFKQGLEEAIVLLFADID